MFEAIAEIAKEVLSNSVEELQISESVIDDMQGLLSRINDVVESSSGGEIVDQEVQQLESNASFLKDGHRYFTDDNGKIYRCDDELLPESEYEINGYKYTTDDMGRITSAEGKVHLKTHEGRLDIKDSKEAIGRGDELPTDDRGHLIGDQLDGSNGMENIVAQDAGINKGAYKSLEDRIAKAVRDGHNVDVKVEPIYGDKLSYRPTEIKYTYTIDGEKNITLFPNGR